MSRILLFVLIAMPAPAPATVLFHDSFDGFLGTGLAPGSVAGALDSLRWRVEGASSGDSEYGARRIGGDFGRGVAHGPVRSGGIYSMQVPDGGPALGLQATASDFAPGALRRRLVEPIQATLATLWIAFEVWFRNDGDRATRVELEVAHGRDDRQWAPAPSLSMTTPGAADTLGWQRVELEGPLPLPELPENGLLELRWAFSDASGRGSRDELALDDVRLIAQTPGDGAVPAPGTRTLLIAALAAYALRRYRQRLGHNRAT